MSAKRKKSKQQDPQSQQVCYHGSTREGIEGHYQAKVDEFLTLLKAGIQDPNMDRSKGEYGVFTHLLVQFRRANPALCIDQGFCKHVFARAASLWLHKHRSPGVILEEMDEMMMASLGLHLKYLIIPSHRGEDVRFESKLGQKNHMYNRRIMTETGLLLCIARHIPCSCMQPYANIAKEIGPMASCYGCCRDFPRDQLRLCSRCKNARYCSRECQVEAWDYHKPSCDLNKGKRG